MVLMGGENRIFCIKVKETSGLSLPLVSFTNFLFIFVVGEVEGCMIYTTISDITESKIC